MQSKILNKAEISSAEIPQARNPYYNEVGFGPGEDMTATDKVGLNILYSCPRIKKAVSREQLELLNFFLTEFSNSKAK